MPRPASLNATLIVQLQCVTLTCVCNLCKVRPIMSTCITVKMLCSGLGTALAQQTRAPIAISLCDNDKHCNRLFAALQHQAYCTLHIAEKLNLNVGAHKSKCSVKVAAEGDFHTCMMQCQGCTETAMLGPSLPFCHIVCHKPTPIMSSGQHLCLSCDPHTWGISQLRLPTLQGSDWPPPG